MLTTGFIDASAKSLSLQDVKREKCKKEREGTDEYENTEGDKVNGKVKKSWEA